MTKGELAKQNFELGLNCAQAVLLSFKEEIGLSEEVLKKSVIGFGGGFGRQKLVCGAVCGMTAAIGFLLSNGDDKLNVYPYVKDACEKFKQKTSSLICEELKKESVSIKCGDLCAIAAECVQEANKSKIGRK